MRDRLPPLFALQAFESAARHGNFSRAANELNLTPGAVSRQIRQLEEWCALTLFERNGPRVRLTREGQDLLSRLSAPLSDLHQAVFPAANVAVQNLQIATMVSTAKAWLLPCLADFAAACPDIRLAVQTDYALVRPPPRVAMVALRYGMPPGPGFYSEVLFEDRLVAVTSPSLAGAIGTDPKRWKSALFLQHQYLIGRDWYQAAELPDDFLPAGPAFNDADVMLDAAELGMGVALCRLSLAWSRLQSGRLVLACDVACKSTKLNLLIVRDECRDLPVVRRFLDWIAPEAARLRERVDSFDNADHPFRLGTSLHEN